MITCTDCKTKNLGNVYCAKCGRDLYRMRNRDSKSAWVRRLTEFELVVR